MGFCLSVTRFEGNFEILLKWKNVEVSKMAKYGFSLSKIWFDSSENEFLLTINKFSAEIFFKLFEPHYSVKMGPILVTSAFLHFKISFKPGR